mmetsp:Transcript_41170/g.53103  ORF Transcript_41170/g.53103 Transcript_41170/m.53103 type:complete len:992 (+) Transcript_41170:88-3063(+)
MTWNNSSAPFRPPEPPSDQNYSIWGGPNGVTDQGSFQNSDLNNLIPLRTMDRPKIGKGISIQITYSNTNLRSFEDNHLSTLFDIELLTPSKNWKVSRRFGEFIMFHQQIPAVPNKPDLPPLQGRDQLGMCRLLVVYLEEVIALPSLRQSHLFSDFLDDQAGLLVLQAEVQTLVQEKNALQNEVSEVRGLLSACTQTIQQQGKALMLFKRRLAALDVSNHRSERRRSSNGRLSNTDRRSRGSLSDRSSHGSSDGFDDFYQGESPNSSPKHFLGELPVLTYADPSFSLNNHADELVSLLTPNFLANRHRNRVVKFIASHIRKSLGATSLCLGSFAERSYLPDQSVAMSCFLCRGQESSWFIRVNETLCKLSGESKSDEVLKISNVNFVNRGDTKHLCCTVNNVAVSLSANQLGGLCFASFVEEVDELLDADHLLKRSLLLVKAWWMYESASDGSRSYLSSYFPEDALTVMVIALFNPPVAPDRQTATIPKTPLEALSLFFQTYMAVDWAKTCITVCGPRDISTSASADVPASLISQTLLDKFRHSFKLKPVTSSAASPTRRRHSRTDLQLDSGDLQPDLVEEEGVPSLRELSESILEDMGDAREFEVREINIVHPLDPLQNLIPPHPIEGKRLARLRAAMIHSATQLAALLALSSNGQHEEANTSLDNMFRHCWARFGSGWRPDCGWSESSRSSQTSESAKGSSRRASYRDSSHSDRNSDSNNRRTSLRESLRGSDTLTSDPPASRRASRRDSAQSSDAYDSDYDSDGEDETTTDCFSMGSDVLWKQVEYCRLLLEVEVTEPAMRTLAAEILTDKGPLPVGEIGKLLQEITANSNLSTILKDKFGGLKKFLEKYEQDFFVSTDHPFNPHVYLRSEVTEEQIKLLLSGQPVSTPLVAPSRRSKKAARRKNNLLATTNNGGGGGGGGGGVPQGTQSPNNPMNNVMNMNAMKQDESRFTKLFVKAPHVLDMNEAVSPRNPNAPVFVPRTLPSQSTL